MKRCVTSPVGAIVLAGTAVAPVPSARGPDPSHGDQRAGHPARGGAQLLQAPAGHLHRREHGHRHELEGHDLHVPPRVRDAAVRILAAGQLRARDRPEQLRLRVRAFGARRRAGQHLGGRRRHRHAHQVQSRGQGADDDRPARGSGRHALEHAGRGPSSTAATRSTASAGRPTSRSISRATSSSPTATSMRAS